MTVPETVAARGFVRPADYYASATPDPVLPSWAAYGCGAAAVAFLLVIFAGGAYLAGGGFVTLMDLGVGMSFAELKGMYAGDVTAEQKASLEREVEAMRGRMRDGTVAPGALQPFLQTVRTVSSDRKVSSAEAKTLIEAAQKAGSPPTRR